VERNRASRRERVFAGPRFLIRLVELDMHPLDATAATRRRRSSARGDCNLTECRTGVCPEGIHLTDNRIIPLKERVVDRRFDPLIWLGSKLGRRPRD
jgi:succinate dehydrogenase / fumarate reductase, iron-sulfur subunit